MIKQYRQYTVDQHYPYSLLDKRTQANVRRKLREFKRDYDPNILTIQYCGVQDVTSICGYIYHWWNIDPLPNDKLIGTSFVVKYQPKEITV